MTKELIAEARRQVGHIEDKSKRERLISDLADALSARQPTEDDREAIAKALCEGADTCWNDLTEQELVWHYRDAESVLAAGFSRATVPDAATEAVWKEGYDLQTAELVKVTAERDTALAAVERVRAIHPNVNGECHTCSDENGPKSWPCPTVAALDGAPEPEWEWEYVIINGLGSGIYTAPTLAEARKQIAIDQSGEGLVPIRTIQRRRKAGPWLPVEGESGGA